MSWKAGKTRPASGLEVGCEGYSYGFAIGRSPPRRQGSGNTPTSTRRSSRSWQGSSTGSRRFSCAATNTQDRRDTRTTRSSGWYNRRSFSIACEREYDELSYSRDLLDAVKAGYEFLIPYYEYFDKSYRMAD